MYGASRYISLAQLNQACLTITARRLFSTTPRPKSNQTPQDGEEKFLTHHVMDLFSLRGRTIAITGGAQGIGLALAFAAAEAGAQVAILDAASKPHDNYNRLKKIARSRYYQADVTDYNGLEQTFERIKEDFGGIHGCITAAGICPDQPFLERPWQEVKRCFDINVLGTFYTAQLAARHMVRNKSQAIESDATSSIVMIGSVAAHRASAGQYISDYCSSKGAVLSLVKELGVELAEQRIRVNCISPGYIRTDLMFDIAKHRPKLAAILQSEPPMKRMGDRLDLKAAAVYLLSEGSAYMTGGEILITGGLHAGRIN
ncbi:uncharacterized protein BJX67DRAFT_383924 [Aspergillus lucknowensis]|uniref:Uncharacterized protein n=1 Tax=Aspergillus lucknowensis TaxID=176173 RepID=A0ABR4LI91_9EURO